MFIIENLNSEIIEKKMGFKFSELELVGKCDSKNNYINFENGKILVKGDLLIEDTEMVMMKMLDDFINEEVVKQWGLVK